MTSLPVTSSILAPGALATLLPGIYDLPGTVSCSLIKAGVNHSYKVTTGEEQYILRVYCLNWRTDTEIAEELRLLDHLWQSGLPVSCAVADRSGSYIQHFDAPEGRRAAVLFVFAPGEKILNTDTAMHARIGALMARLYQVTEGFMLNRTSYTTTTLLDRPWQELLRFLPEDTDAMQYMSSARERLRVLLDNAALTPLRKGAVHLDIWMDNLNIATDGSVTLFDFDFCGNGWLCLDLAYYVMQLYVLEPDEQVFRLKQAAFLDAYQSIVPLSAEELHLVPLLGPALYFFYLGVQCSRFDDWSNVFINDTYLKRFIEVRVKKYETFVCS